MGYGILAKNPEAEYVDDLSMWSQKREKKEYLYVFLLMMTTETSKAVFPFLAAFFSLEFLQKGLL